MFPNIVGKTNDIVMWEYQGHKYSGALFENGSRHDSAGSHGASYWNIIGLNASRSNAIYGRSGTVQPETLRSLYIIKY